MFATKHISVIEKRILMKFLNFCVNFQTQPDVYSTFVEKTFHEFLRHQKLTENLVHFVLHSIAMVDKQTGKKGSFINANPVIWVPRYLG